MSTDMAMMEQKWRLMFHLMDIDKDGRLSTTDHDKCKQGFMNAYKPDPEAANKLEAEVDAHWDTLWTLGGGTDSSQGISEDMFVQKMTELFQNDKSCILEKVSSGFKHLLSAADNSNDGLFTFDKFLKFNAVFEMLSEVVVRITFNLIGPNDDDVCSLSQVLAFYVELFVGEDKDRFDAIQRAYSELSLI